MAAATIITKSHLKSRLHVKNFIGINEPEFVCWFCFFFIRCCCYLMLFSTLCDSLPVFAFPFLNFKFRRQFEFLIEIFDIVESIKREYQLYFICYEKLGSAMHSIKHAMCNFVFLFRGNDITHFKDEWELKVSIYINKANKLVHFNFCGYTLFAMKLWKYKETEIVYYTYHLNPFRWTFSFIVSSKSNETQSKTTKKIEELSLSEL